MKYLNTILSNYDVNLTVKNKIKEHCLQIHDKLEQYQIAFDNENSEMIFTNHIVSLVKRILNQSFIDEIDESMLKEVSNEAMAIARSLVEEVFTKNQCVVNPSEVFLVATHIQLYLNQKKEELNHE